MRGGTGTVGVYADQRRMAAGVARDVFLLRDDGQQITLLLGRHRVEAGHVARQPVAFAQGLSSQVRGGGVSVGKRNFRHVLTVAQKAPALFARRGTNRAAWQKNFDEAEIDQHLPVVDHLHIDYRESLVTIEADEARFDLHVTAVGQVGKAMQMLEAIRVADNIEWNLC